MPQYPHQPPPPIQQGALQWPLGGVEPFQGHRCSLNLRFVFLTHCETAFQRCNQLKQLRGSTVAAAVRKGCWCVIGGRNTPRGNGERGAYNQAVLAADR